MNKRLLLTRLDLDVVRQRVYLVLHGRNLSARLLVRLVQECLHKFVLNLNLSRPEHDLLLHFAQLRSRVYLGFFHIIQCFFQCL